jgi:protein SCO1/2
LGYAEDPIKAPEFDGVEIGDKLGTQIPLDLKFKDEFGKDVTLADYVNGDKPVLLTMVYYNCPMLCSLVLNGAINTLKDLGWVPGDKFEAVSVSISPRETPELALAKKQNYMNQLGMAGAEKGWHFLTGEQEQIKALAASIGFGYRYDPSSQDYSHGAALFFISPTGKLTRLLKGIQFESKELRLSFVEASEGKIGSIIDNLLLRCFRYEPSSKKYAFYIWGAVRLGGIFTILAIGLLLLVLWRGERQQHDLSPR